MIKGTATITSVGAVSTRSSQESQNVFIGAALEGGSRILAILNSGFVDGATPPIRIIQSPYRFVISRHVWAREGDRIVHTCEFLKSERIPKLVTPTKISKNTSLDLSRDHDSKFIVGVSMV